MKNILLVILFIFHFSFFIPCKAQYIVLENLTGINGMNPNGDDLYYDGRYLYGMTTVGGVYGSGVLFRINPDGTGDTVLHSFNYASIMDGDDPDGSLFDDGTYLYGMLFGGGIDSAGIIFRIKPDGTGFADIHDFTKTDGFAPYGSLISDGIYLYGVTNSGGTTDDGVVFKIKPDGTGDTVLHSFTGIDGVSPEGSLLYDGTYFYGTTSGGGDSNKGVIFRIKPDGTGDTVILNFTGQNGSSPAFCTLISDGTSLYGMTINGGNDVLGGVIFRIKPNGTGDTVLFNFPTGFADTAGNHPLSSLIFCPPYLYGMTESAGAFSDGVIFRIRTDGTDYTVLHSFSGTDGNRPRGALIPDGTDLYGMTLLGGDSNDGVIFKYENAITGVNEAGTKNAELSVFPIPSTGKFNISYQLSANSQIEVYNVLGEKVYSASQPLNPHAGTFPKGIHSESELDLSGQPNGVYFYSVENQSGSLIGSGKLVVER